MTQTLAKVLKGDVHAVQPMAHHGTLTTAGTPVLTREEESEMFALEKAHEEKVRKAKRMMFKDFTPEDRQAIVDHNKVLQMAEEVNDMDVKKSKRLQELLAKRPWGMSGSKAYQPSRVIYDFTLEQLEMMHSEAVLEEIIDEK